MNTADLASSLMDKGFRLLQDLEYPEALRIGQRLVRIRHTSGFEIAALAYLGLDQLQKATTVLEQGVRVAGRLGILHQLLGNCYSEARQFVKAQREYARALECANTDAETVHLNRAIAFERENRVQDAMKAIQMVRSPRFSRDADSMRVRLFLEAGETRQAEHLATKLARTKSKIPVFQNRERESDTRFVCAKAFHAAGKTGRALRLAKRAIHLNPAKSEALSLLRTIKNKTHPNSKMFFLLVEGLWPQPILNYKRPPGFFRSCQVVAPDETAALAYVKELEESAIRASLEIEESKVIKKRPACEDGVYYLSGRGFYPRRKPS